MLNTITAKEAAGKFCCADPVHECTAADCMAWRILELRRQRFFTAEDTAATAEPARPANVPASWEWCGFDPEDGEEPAGWLEPVAECLLNTPGFCGLAGRPDPLFEARAAADHFAEAVALRSFHRTGSGS